MLGIAAPLDALDQQAGALEAQHLPGLVDAGQVVLGKVAGEGVVIADYGQVLRDGKTRILGVVLQRLKARELAAYYTGYYKTYYGKPPDTSLVKRT
jgi:hypothetical protein